LWRNAQVEIAGVVSNSTFRNEDAGHAVARSAGGIIAEGTTPFVAVGCEHAFFGRFATHARHGERFEIAKYEFPPPDNEQKTAAFIRGGLIFGAEPATAQKLRGSSGGKPQGCDL
jgi:hypothetical protein